jgi:SLAP domain-containing protein
MVSFFKRLRFSKAKESEREIISIDSEEVRENREGMTLFFSDEFERYASSEEKYILHYFLDELPPLKKGMVAIDGYKLTQDRGRGVTLVALLRNNKEEEISLSRVPLLLCDADHNMIARKVFTREVGTIPACTAIPWRFVFEYDDFLVSHADLSSWSIAFQMEDGSACRETSILNFEIEDSFSKEKYIEAQDQRVLAQIKKAIEKTENQVNFIGRTVYYTEDGKLVAELFLRNGREQEVALDDHMIFTLRDAEDDIVASQAFDMSHIRLSPKSVTRWMLVYEVHAQYKDEPDFREWLIAAEKK